MTSTGNDELDRQQFALRWKTATTAERRAMLQERRAAIRARGLTPRQARRIRIVIAGFFMVVAAVGLVVRLREQQSLLTVGLYGAALILCGIVIELSRRGRTRLGMWLLVTGLAAVAVADQMLRVQ